MRCDQKDLLLLRLRPSIQKCRSAIGDTIDIWKDEETDASTTRMVSLPPTQVTPALPVHYRYYARHRLVALDLRRIGNASGVHDRIHLSRLFKPPWCVSLGDDDVRFLLLFSRACSSFEKTSLVAVSSSSVVSRTT